MHRGSVPRFSVLSEVKTPLFYSLHQEKQSVHQEKGSSFSEEVRAQQQIVAALLRKENSGADLIVLSD